MSKYTMQLRYCLQALNNYEEEESIYSGFEDIENNINDARTKVFSFSYPFYTDNAILKTNFEKKFLRHFYTREIGSETFGLFQLRLKQKFDLIMPYYKKLFDTVIDYDLFTQLNEETYETSSSEYNKSGDSGSQTDNLGTQGTVTDNTGTQTMNASNGGTITNVSTDSGTTRTIETEEEKLRFLDTPQGDISNVGTIDTSGYLTNANVNNRSSDNTVQHGLTNNNTQTNNLTDNSLRTDNLKTSVSRTDNLKTVNAADFEEDGHDHMERISTYTGTKGKTKSELIDEYRKTIINIDESIFNECNDLFMLVY